MHRLTSLGLFLLFVIVAVAVGGLFIGGDWYQNLNQPSWNPPAMVMASVWAVVYVLMAVSAWMVWDTRRGLAIVPLGLSGLQLLLSICWSWMYFGLHRPGWALAVMTLWLLVALTLVVIFRPIRIEASKLMIPVASWLLFSWVLGFVQWHLNGGGISSLF
jgi:benzodiazapine receptor